MGVFADLDVVSQQYQEVRTATVQAAEHGVEVAVPWLEALRGQVRSMTDLRETFAGYGESFVYLRERTERLRADLLPLREGAHAALRRRPARADGGPGRDGWHDWQAGLTALGDRLTELHGGRVTPTAHRRSATTTAS